MSDRLIPPMSLWRVEPFVAPSIMRDIKRGAFPPDYAERYTTTVNGTSVPTGRSWMVSNEHQVDIRSVKFTPGEVLTVLRTVRGVLDELDSNYEFVEVVLPRHCYINRTHFNAGMGYLTRIA